MKTTKLKYLATGLMFLLVLGACNDDLNRFPTEQIERSQSFQTVDDAATWNTGMYALLQNRVYGVFRVAQDIQVDKLNASVDYGNRSGGIHRWDFLASDYDLETVWQLFYSGIANANVAIEGIQTIETETAEEQAQLDRYLADAYLVRAYYYHQLVLRFADAYDPASANSDLGVPIMPEYDIDNFPARSTVEQVYQQILSDIEAAKPGLSNVPGEQGAIYFTSDVATALEARVRFYMEDWAGAKALADELIESGRYPLIDNQEQFNAYWEMDGEQEDILQLFTSTPNETARTNAVYLGYDPGNERFSPDFIPSQWVIEQYDEEDIRRPVYFDQKPVTLGGVDYEDVYLVDKYPGNPELWTGVNTNYQHAPKVFRIAEMYLISAEAGARGAGDGLDPLNDLRTARGVEAVDASGDALFEVVKEERSRELAFEGVRLYDLKRWDEGFTRRDPQNPDFLQQGQGFLDFSVEADNPKFTWGIPTNDITINPNLEGQQNPGW